MEGIVMRFQSSSWKITPECFRICWWTGDLCSHLLTAQPSPFFSEFRFHHTQEQYRSWEIPLIGETAQHSLTLRHIFFCTVHVGEMRRMDDHGINQDEKINFFLAWCCASFIPALKGKRQTDSLIQGQPGLQSEFQDSQGCDPEKPSLKKPKTN